MNGQERQQLIQYRLDRARDTYREIDLHVEHELWNTAMNRLYYACYYAVSALLLGKILQHKLIPVSGKCSACILLKRE